MECEGDARAPWPAVTSAKAARVRGRRPAEQLSLLLLVACSGGCVSLSFLWGAHAAGVSDSAASRNNSSFLLSLNHHAQESCGNRCAFLTAGDSQPLGRVVLTIEQIFQLLL